MSQPIPRTLLFFALLLAACTPAAPAATPTVEASATPPVPSATPSITPEPTATSIPASPTPLPRFFAEEFDGAAPAWSLLQSNGETPPATRLQDGALVLDITEPNQWTYTILGAEEYVDSRLDARVQSRGTGPEALGLICRYTESNGWYEFNISSDGTYSVLFGQWLAEGIATYSPIAAADSEYLNRGGEANEIGLVCQEDTLWLYLNGKLFRKLDVERFGLKSGRLGLAAGSFQNLPVIAAFDWVKVSEP